MFYYINQPRAPSFPIGLVKTESDFIVRSVDTHLRRWTLVAAVIIVDVYSIFGFLRPDLSPWGYRNRCFLVALCCLIVRRPNLEVSTKRRLHQQVKIPGYFLCHVAHGSTSLQPFSIMWIFLRSLVVTCYDRSVLSEVTMRSQKLLQGLVFHELTAYFSVFHLFCKSDNFESNNSLKLSFMNIWGLCSNFVKYHSSLKSNSPNIYALCEKNLNDSIDSGNFSVKGYFF